MNHLFDEHFNDDVLREICARYGLKLSSAKLIKEDANLVYDCGDSILRVSYSGIRTMGDVEAELDWMDFLHRENVSVAKIILSRTKNQQEKFGTDADHFTAVRFEKIQGNKISKETWNPTHFQKLGKLTGQIHRTSQAYHHQDQLVYKHWDELVECSYVTMLPEDDRQLQQLVAKLMDGFRTLERNPKHYGMIHNDIHHENYLLVGAENKIVLFDFEVACRSWYVYEIATALYYACLINRKQNDVDFEQVFLTNFLKGYRTVYDLPPVKFETILKFMLYRDLFLYGYMLALCRHKSIPEPVRNYLIRLDTSIAARRSRLGV